MLDVGGKDKVLTSSMPNGEKVQVWLRIEVRREDRKGYSYRSILVSMDEFVSELGVCGNLPLIWIVVCVAIRP